MALGSTETIGPDGQGVPALVWTGATWSTSGNAAINTPNYGSELVTNGTFSTDTSGWTASGATLASVAGGNNGNGLQVTNSGAAAGFAYQSFTTVIGQYYKVVGSYKNGTGASGGIIRIGTSAGATDVSTKSNNSAGAFSSRTQFFRASQTTTFISLALATTVSGDTTLFDDISVVPVTNAELFASLATSTKDVIADVNIAATGVQAGLVVNLDSATTPQNFVIAYIDNNNSAVAQLVKGVWDGSKIVYTVVITASVTFSAGATLRVIKDGTSYQLFYNNAKVGSTSTISDAAIISNTLHGLFTPSNAASLDNFLLFPRGSTANEYAALDSY